MYINNFNNSNEYRLQQVLHTLKNVYGAELALDKQSDDDLVSLSQSSEIVKNSIISESRFNTYNSNPEYAKHMLIMEAVRLYLTEIAPKRAPKRKIKESTERDTNDLVKLGREMMAYSAKTNHGGNERELSILNAISKVGDKLTQMGEPFGPKGLTDTDKKILIIAKRRLGLIAPAQGDQDSMQGLAEGRTDAELEQAINKHDTMRTRHEDQSIYWGNKEGKATHPGAQQQYFDKSIQHKEAAEKHEKAGKVAADMLASRQTKLNEISKETLGSYISRAADDAVDHSHLATIKSSSPKFSDNKEANAHSIRHFNRIEGIKKATSRLVNGHVNEADDNDDAMLQRIKNELASIEAELNSIIQDDDVALDEMMGKGKIPAAVRHHQSAYNTHAKAFRTHSERADELEDTGGFEDAIEKHEDLAKDSHFRMMRSDARVAHARGLLDKVEANKKLKAANDQIRVAKLDKKDW
jgi:hypothetical protein